MDTSLTIPSLLPILKKIPLFTELDEAQHQAIIQNIQMQYFQKGHTIFSQGDPGDGMFIIKSGMCRVVRKKPTGEEQEIAVLEPNDFFGEMALISDEPRNATVVTVSDSEMFVLRKADFFHLVEKTPGLASRISNEFIKRVKKNTKDGQV